ncbi:MAG: DUF3846 domain-containing protein [Clostridia bacterium]|nr:DUF3846 domain-containing protein [Clostridia bacterium]
MTKEIKALLVPVGKEPKEITIANELKALQDAVKGYIEFFSISRGINLIVNEEGKINGMEGNRLVGNEIICGDFLVVGDNGMGETISLSPAQIKLCKEHFKTPLEFTREQIEDNLVVRVIDLNKPESLRDTRPVPMPKRYGTSKKKNYERER